MQGRKMATQASIKPNAPSRAIGEEHRRARRRLVAVPGLIGLPGLRLVIPCFIREMSATGAQVDISHSRIHFAQDLPDQIVLVLVHDQVEVDGTIRWRDREHFGVSFRSLLRPSTRHMRR